MTVFLRIAERLDFRVWFAGTPVPAASDDFAAPHQHRADRRIRRRHAATAPRQTDGLSHVIQIIFGKEFLSRIHLDANQRQDRPHCRSRKYSL